MSRALEDYLDWLRPQVKPGGAPHHHDLLQQMMLKEFVWLVPNDDNRVQDGIDLRSEYFGSITTDPYVLGAVSSLEVVVGLSRRIGFMLSEPPPKWCWVLLKNLGVTKFRDPIGPRRREQVEEILDRFVWRQYEPDGDGGLFPLAWPKRDQREVELWYQMCAYVDEMYEP